MFNLFKPKEKNQETIAKLPLMLTNTKSGKLETFKPINEDCVSIYSCGPTVYDIPHIGNLRAYVFVDTLIRTLHYNGYNTNHTVNFTDFGHLTDDGDDGDDKMMKALRREDMDISLESMRMLSDRYIKAFMDDMESLNILPPSQYARASDYIDEQIELISSLEDSGYTYVIDDGVYFDVSKYKEYGTLGNLNLAGQKAGARIASNPQKKDPHDFCLWKFGDIGWESKWGKGCPGWHIECSAMAFATLGTELDIHTGGVDHITVHHNNEIAQSECASGKTFARYWLHNEHLTMEGEKISKSSGQALTLNDLYQKGYTADVYRYWLLTAHYRTRVQYSDTALSNALNAVNKLKRLMFETWPTDQGTCETKYVEKFHQAINNDLDTPSAVAVLWEVARDPDIKDTDKRALVLHFDQILGLGLDIDPEKGRSALGYLSPADVPEDVTLLIEERQVARIAQNWTEADRIRDAITARGYQLEDTPEGARVSLSELDKV